ncbi:hypothetical protein E2C01_055007 [Portunus trituberculatus]|uniref:Uncharacterized protein n=1 Tax=Portunus trituberculatus TaxID=210409 RepID=A0A5B7GU56_PORTR|nr:hypothetical protein [Portunus trituberculatus]
MKNSIMLVCDKIKIMHINCVWFGSYNAWCMVTWQILPESHASQGRTSFKCIRQQHKLDDADKVMPLAKEAVQLDSNPAITGSIPPGEHIKASTNQQMHQNTISW